jgi:cytochrome c oxidase cbb3-type subunit 3
MNRGKLRGARVALLTSVAALVAVLATSCKQESGEQRSEGGRAPLSNVIGPQPGPDYQLASMRNPYDADKAALNDGHRLFVWYNCAGCHGDHGGGGMGPSLRDSVWLYGSDDAQIFSSIAVGRQRGMPAWGTKLPRDDIWKLVAYIKSMRTPNEPDAPSQHR